MDERSLLKKHLDKADPVDPPTNPTDKPVDKPTDQPGQPTDKPVDKPTDKPVDKPTDKPDQGNNQPTLDDVTVLKYLSEKQGSEISSIDELFKEKVVEKPVEKPIDYASEQVKALDEYVRETGRTPNEFFKLQRDWTKVPDDDVAREYLKSQKPGLSDEDINDIISIRYKIEEKKDEDGNTLNKQEVKLASLDYKDLISSGRQFFENEKSKYSLPAESNKPDSSWNDRVSTLLNQDEIKVTVNEQEHFLTDKQALKNRYSSLDSVMSDKAFAGQDGNFDPVKFISVVEKGLNADQIVKRALENAETRIREEVLKELPDPANPIENPSNPPRDDSGDLPAKDKERVLANARRRAR